MQPFGDNLIVFSTSLTSDHLGLAVEAFHRMDSSDNRSKNAITSILHGFSGLESAINLIGFDTFFNTDSVKYIPEEKRDLPLKKLLKSWNASLPCIEKIDFIFSIHKEKLDDTLRNKLIELNNLRNWIAHGFPYKTTYLIEPHKDNPKSGTVLDYEYSIDWSKKFPMNKFSPLDKLNKSDAEKALTIIFTLLIKLATITKQPFHFCTYIDKPNYRMIYDEVKLEKLFEK